MLAAVEVAVVTEDLVVGSPWIGNESGMGCDCRSGCGGLGKGCGCGSCYGYHGGDDPPNLSKCSGSGEGFESVSRSAVDDCGSA